jgi:hypothetical protein
VWTPRASTSRSQVEGARVSLLDGDLVIVLMHAEGSSDGRGRLYVVRINDATFVDSTRDGDMTLAVPDVFTIRIAGTSARAGRFTGEVVNVAWLNNSGLTQMAAAVDAAGGAGTTTRTHELRAAVKADSHTAEADGSGLLPLTGSHITMLILAALTLLELGAAMTIVRNLGRARA